MQHYRGGKNEGGVVTYDNEGKESFKCFRRCYVDQCQHEVDDGRGTNGVQWQMCTFVDLII